MRRGLFVVLVILTLALIVGAFVVTFQRQGELSVQATATPASTALIPRITVEALRAELASSTPPLVWDFRPVSTFAEGHIPGSRALTLEVIPDAAANVEKGVAIVTVCA